LRHASSSKRNMQTPTALLKIIGKALLDTAGTSLAGDFVIEVLPEVVQEVWSHWSREFSEAQRYAEVAALVQTPTEEVNLAIAEVVTELTAEQSPMVSQALAGYLGQVPPTMRHWLRRPEDPTGTTLPQRLPLQRAEDLLPFLPARLPRFKAGDVP